MGMGDSRRNVPINMSNVTLLGVTSTLISHRPTMPESCTDGDNDNDDDKLAII